MVFHTHFLLPKNLTSIIVFVYTVDAAKYHQQNIYICFVVVVEKHQTNEIPLITIIIIH